MNVNIENNLIVIKSEKGQPILLLQIEDARELSKQLENILPVKSATNKNEWRTSLRYNCSDISFNIWSPKKQN